MGRASPYQEAKGDDLEHAFQGEDQREGDIQVLEGQLIGAGGRVILGTHMVAPGETGTTLGPHPSLAQPSPGPQDNADSHEGKAQVCTLSGSGVPSG